MKYQLSIENSEIYRNLPLYPFYKRYKNVRNDLMQLHPGFTDESIWDFQKNKKGITACVISRDFYEEKRIFHPLCRFVAMEEGKKRRMKEVEFFKWPDYTRDGKRRKRKGLAIVLSIIGLCSLLAGLVCFQNNGLKKIQEQSPVEAETEGTVAVFQNLTSQMEKCVSIINSWGGQLVFMESTRLGNTVCRFGVYGGNVSTCVQELKMLENLQNVTAENLNWVDGKWEYTINCLFCETVEPEQRDLHHFDFLSCFSKGEACIAKTGLQLISSVIDEGNNLVYFTFLLKDEKPDSAFLETLEKTLYEEKCILESLKINAYGETDRNSFIIEAGIRELNDSAVIKDFPSESIPFIWKEITENSPAQLLLQSSDHKSDFEINRNNGSISSAKKDDLESSELVEIGRVKKGNRIIVYFRNNDGKIYTKILGE